MNDNEINMPKKKSEEERYKLVPVELSGDDVMIIENYIGLHPELGYNTVEDYLEGLLELNMNELKKELGIGKGGN